MHSHKSYNVYNQCSSRNNLDESHCDRVILIACENSRKNILSKLKITKVSKKKKFENMLIVQKSHFTAKL
jgi:hypothetical protein